MTKPGPKPQGIDLPSWFDLQKYERAHDLTLQGWYEQFAIRYGLWGRDFSRRPARIGMERQQLDLIRQEGIPDLAKVEGGSVFLRFFNVCLTSITFVV